MRKWLALWLVVLSGLPAHAEVVVKLGTVAPEGSPWHRVLKELADTWDKESGGQVKLKIYPGGVAGDEGDMIRKMRVGQLQASALSFVGLRDVDPSLQGTIIPGLFANEEEVQCVLEKLSPTYKKKLADSGFVVLAWGDTGWVYFFSKKEVHTPQDLKGLKLYTWAGDPGVADAWRKIGFQPVVLSINDLTTSLATGMVDSFAFSPIVAFTARWYERTPHMVDFPWSRLAGAIVITQESWNKVPEALRPKLLDAATKAGADINKAVAKMGSSALRAMEKNGLQIIRLTDEQRKQWFTLAESSWPFVRGSIVPSPAFDQVKKARDECRAH
jgi:TRAP-type C4-dicarboxylate transport system substrate-binding protein